MFRTTSSHVGGRAWPCAAALRRLSETTSARAAGRCRPWSRRSKAAPGAEPDQVRRHAQLRRHHRRSRRTINGVEGRMPTIFNDLGRVDRVADAEEPGRPGSPTSPTDDERRDLHPLPGGLHPRRRPQHAGRRRAVSVRFGRRPSPPAPARRARPASSWCASRRRRRRRCAGASPAQRCDASSRPSPR